MLSQEQIQSLKRILGRRGGPQTASRLTFVAEMATNNLGSDHVAAKG
jgi:hypothetical protein